jgi:metallo-beta-lactamase family protein
MDIQFIGATGTVTGSKYLISSGSKCVLVDCGLFQGLKQLRLKNWAPLPFKASKIQNVILTHAHIDHTGYIPLLVKKGFRGKIYCSHGTEELCKNPKGLHEKQQLHHLRLLLIFLKHFRKAQFRDFLEFQR